MRVRIIGGIGSGKTYLARKLADRFTIPMLPLDGIVWDNDADYYKKRRPQERDALLEEMLAKKAWIIEGVYYERWAHPTIRQADHFIYLDVPRARRHYRVIRRFVVAKLGRGHSYEKSFKDVRVLLRLDKGWEKGIRRAGTRAVRCASADEAYRHILEQQRH